MKMVICDVCYHDKGKVTGKISIAKYTSKARDNHSATLKIDICEEHKKFITGLTFEQAREKINKEIYGF
jgi:hypothetical protein